MASFRPFHSPCGVQYISRGWGERDAEGRSNTPGTYARRKQIAFGNSDRVG